MVIRELVTRLGFEINQSQINSFDKQIGHLKNNLKGVSRNLRDIANDMGRVGRTMSIFISAPLVGIGLLSIKAAAEIEQVALSLEVMLGSAKKGKKLLKELFDFAKKTPFEIEKIAPTAKQMLAMGIEADKMIDTLTMLGNVAAGLGVPLFRLSYNFGQVKSQTRLTGVELKDFTRAGVPLLETLSEMIFGTKNATVQIREMAGRGEISFKLVEKAFKKMTEEGGKFHKLMERMAEKTLIGVWSNFLDGVFLVRKELGDIIVEVLNLQNVFKKLNKILDKVVDWFKKLNAGTKKFIVFIGIFLIALGPLLMMLSAVARSIFFLHSALLILKTSFFVGAAGATTFNFALLLLPIIILAVVAALALLVEDISVWVRGGRSTIGRLLGPWENWRNNMLTFFSQVKNGFKDLLTGDIDKLIEKGKLLAKTFKIFVKDIGLVTQEKIIAPGVTQVRRGRQFINEAELRRGVQGEIEKGQFKRFIGGGSTVSIGDINTEVIVSPGEGGSPQDIANTVEEVLSRKIVETINNNLTQ